jgi:hypothetical protein
MQMEIVEVRMNGEKIICKVSLTARVERKMECTCSIRHRKMCSNAVGKRWRSLSWRCPRKFQCYLQERLRVTDFSAVLDHDVQDQLNTPTPAIQTSAFSWQLTVLEHLN